MVQLRVTQDLHYRVHSAGFRIIRAVHQLTNARVNDRASAHPTRFNCNKQVAVAQAIVPQDGAGGAQRDDFGVRRGIVVCNIPVPSASNDLALMDDHGADRDLS